jgi:hypothetical protein
MFLPLQTKLLTTVTFLIMSFAPCTYMSILVHLFGLPKVTNGKFYFKNLTKTVTNS